MGTDKMLKKAQRVLKGTWSAAITIAVMLISHRIDGTLTPLQSGNLFATRATLQKRGAGLVLRPTRRSPNRLHWRI